MQAQAERAAWDLAKEAGLDLVTINPSLVLGPVLTSRADATSIILMKVREHADVSSVYHGDYTAVMEQAYLACLAQAVEAPKHAWRRP